MRIYVSYYTGIDYGVQFYNEVNSFTVEVNRSNIVYNVHLYLSLVRRFCWDCSLISKWKMNSANISSCDSFHVVRVYAAPVIERRSWFEGEYIEKNRKKCATIKFRKQTTFVVLIEISL